MIYHIAIAYYTATNDKIVGMIIASTRIPMIIAEMIFFVLLLLKFIIAFYLSKGL